MRPPGVPSERARNQAPLHAGHQAGGAGMRFVCDACQDITNIEADRMEIQGDKLMVYSRGRLVYVADLGQIMLAKLAPGREETR